MKIDIKKLIKSIALPLVVGAVAGFLTRGSMEDFELLNKPALSPPGWLFPVVWTVLYILMGISFYLVDEANATSKEISEAKRIYYFQLAVNFLWSFFFFNFQWYLFAFIWLLLLWVLVLVMIKRFAGISKVAAYLNIPYLLWVTFAGYLNLAIWLLNR